MAVPFKPSGTGLRTDRMLGPSFFLFDGGGHWRPDCSVFSVASCSNAFVFALTKTHSLTRTSNLRASSLSNALYRMITDLWLRIVDACLLHFVLNT
jgi:hypothetical protein